MNDPLCLKNMNADDYPALVGYSDNHDDTVTPPYHEDEKSTDYDVTYEVNYETGVFRGDYYPYDSERDFSAESRANKIKRSLELVEEQPPEGTYRPQYDENEATTARPMPSMPSAAPQTPTAAMPSVPSIPQPPTMPPTGRPNAGPNPANDVATRSPDAETLETTTEDYGGDEEPNCEYDPLTWVVKCGLNLITSMLGFSDTCCKPIF